MRNSATGGNGGMARARRAALMLCCALAAAAGAQPGTAPNGAAPTAAPAKTDATSGKSTGQANDKGKAEREIKIDTGRPPDRFIPTEEIPEDFSVSFPVDI